MKEVVIFGAKSIAIGAYLAIKELYTECEVSGFLVSSLIGNPESLCGLPVMDMEHFDDKDKYILIATPENIQGEIERILIHKGYKNIICLDSVKESKLMGKYYEKMGIFPSLNRNSSIAEVYMAKFHKDKLLKNNYVIPNWIIPIQVGAALTDRRAAEITDDMGENISSKNVNYSELTALYWIWKNRLQIEGGAQYFGLFHYRRFLDITDESLLYMKYEDIDVVLPYPMVHLPDIREHHGRYVQESDWDAMMQALAICQPQYVEGFKNILQQPYLYNFNIIVAKKDILKDYCEWLFPILEKTEELSSPKGWERADRYIGYLGENLLTLYFMFHADKWKIRHVGKKMLI